MKETFGYFCRAVGNGGFFMSRGAGRFRQAALLILAGLLLAAALALGQATTAAQTGDGYDLTWSTIAGGGGASAGGLYSLDGTIGQSQDRTLSGGSFSLAGGFWEGGVIMEMVYLPVMSKQ